MKSKKNDNFLQDLYSVIEKRAKGKDKKSYTRSLIKGGKRQNSWKSCWRINRINCWLSPRHKKRVVEEASDLIYHLLVMLHSKKITLKDIKKELSRRKNVRR